MKSALFVLLVSFCLAFTGCTAKEKHARNTAAAKSWLAVNDGAGGARVSGAWKPSDEGWGAAILEQKGSRITGAIGDYAVEGHVKERDVYLVLWQGGSAHYSAVLRKNGPNLSGFYSESVPFDTRYQHKFALRRVAG